MIGQVDKIAMVFIEVLHDTLFTSPHVDVVLRVAEVGGQTRPKITCSKDEDLGILRWLWF